MSEPLRAGRLLNAPIGLALAILPACSGRGDAREWVLGLAFGLAIVLLAFRRGPIRERYGAWDALIV